MSNTTPPYYPKHEVWLIVNKLWDYLKKYNKLGWLSKWEKSPERWSSQGPGAWTPTKPPRSFSRSDYDDDNDDNEVDDGDDEDDDDELPEASCSAQNQFLWCCERGARRGKQMSEIWSIIFCWSNMEYLHVEIYLKWIVMIFRYSDVYEADRWQKCYQNYSSWPWYSRRGSCSCWKDAPFYPPAGPTIKTHSKGDSSYQS